MNEGTLLFWPAISTRRPINNKQRRPVSLCGQVDKVDKCTMLTSFHNHV